MNATSLVPSGAQQEPSEPGIALLRTDSTGPNKGSGGGQANSGKGSDSREDVTTADATHESREPQLATKQLGVPMGEDVSGGANSGEVEAARSEESDRNAVLQEYFGLEGPHEVLTFRIKISPPALATNQLFLTNRRK